VFYEGKKKAGLKHQRNTRKEMEERKDKGRVKARKKEKGRQKGKLGRNKKRK
jgi:hypothetical protein